MAEEAPIEGEDGSGEAVAAKPSRRISITWDAADTKLTGGLRSPVLFHRRGVLS